jgi:hypothetical protein
MKPDEKLYIEELRKRLAARKAKAAEGEITKKDETTSVTR